MQTRIKEIRKSQGMSLRMLADLSDLTKESILNVEAGRTDPKLSTLLAIADALHVPLAESDSKHSQSLTASASLLQHILQDFASVWLTQSAKKTPAPDAIGLRYRPSDTI